MRLLPNLFIIGAAKSGTTSLYYYLRQHPQIFFPREKEPHFFDDDVNYAEGVSEYIERYFFGSEKFPLRGEATPWYLYKWAKVIPRMQLLYENNLPKFIVLLRNPVERAWSHYLHMVRIQRESLSFAAALSEESSRLVQNDKKWLSYYSEGVYSEQLLPWFNTFGRQRFKVYLTDDLAIDAQAVIRDIFSFLEIDDYADHIDLSVKNAASTPLCKGLMKFVTMPPRFAHILATMVIPKQTRRKLIHLVKSKNLKKTQKNFLPERESAELYKRYEKEIERLEHLLDRDLSRWKRVEVLSARE